MIALLVGETTVCQRVVDLARKYGLRPALTFEVDGAGRRTLPARIVEALCGAVAICQFSLLGVA